MFRDKIKEAEVKNEFHLVGEVKNNKKRLYKYFVQKEIPKNP